MGSGLHLYAAAVGELELELDWELLGRAACEGDGSAFYDAALRERILDTGFRLAQELGGSLEPGGKSLYVGAEVAEFPQILAECLLLDRRVEWLNLACDAAVEMARALGEVGAKLGVELPRPRADGIDRLGRARFDHLWLVSVLTDPDHFPALHDELYQRRASALATGRGDLVAERSAAVALIDALLERARKNCLISASEEEWTLVEPRIRGRQWQLEFLPGQLTTACVGDVVRFARVCRA